MELFSIIAIAIIVYGINKYIPAWLYERDRARDTREHEITRLKNLRKHTEYLQNIGLPYIAEHYSQAMADALNKALFFETEKNETKANKIRYNLIENIAIALFLDNKNNCTKENKAESKLIENLYLLHSFIFKSACRKCIKLHVKTLARKKKSLIYRDDYGREIHERWIKEVQYFTEEILIPFLEKESLENKAIDLEASHSYEDHVHNYNYKYIEFYVEIIEDALDDLVDDEEEKDLPDNGHDYERYVADIFESYGYNARVTKGSGDHGADIIVNHGEGYIAVQCKHYSSPVGNKAVQEAYSAKDFYDADQAWVVASNSFTPSAKIAAQKLGVWLIHHEDLPELLEAIDSGTLERGLADGASIAHTQWHDQIQSAKP